MTEKQLNDQIKKMAKNNRISYPENYDAFICKVLEELPEEPEEADRRSRWKKKREKSGWAPTPVLLLAALIIVAVGASAGAVVHGYLKRMETMPEQVKEELVDSVEGSEKDIDSFSREFTKEEKKRGEQLAAEYEAGKRYPEKELPVLEDAAMASEHSLYFVRTNSTFYLPEKELTDEELLEIIDFYFKRDYSLMVDGQKKENIEESIGKLSKKKAVILAQGFVQDVYGEDVSGWKYTIEKYTTDSDKRTYYTIHFEINTSKKKYVAEINRETEECTVLAMEYKKVSHYKDGQFVSSKEIEELHENGLVMIQKIKKDISFEKMQCRYMSPDSERVSMGILDFIYLQNDQKGYVFRYSLQTKCFFFINKVENVSQYMSDYKDRAKQRGCKVMKVELTKSNVAEKEAN